MAEKIDISSVIKRDISNIIKHIGPETGRSNSGMSWWAVTHSGNAVSLFYDIQPSNVRPGVIEFLDKRGFLKLNTDDFGIGFINISDLNKFFLPHID
jgi:hypothetical protein